MRVQVAIVTHHDFLKSNLARSFAPGEVRAYRLEGTRLTALDGLGGEASPTAMKLRTGLKLSGFSRSPRSSPGSSRSISRSPSQSDVRGAAGAEHEQHESPPSSPRVLSSNELLSAFVRSAVSVARKSSPLKLKVGSVPSELNSLG